MTRRFAKPTHVAPMRRRSLEDPAGASRYFSSHGGARHGLAWRDEAGHGKARTILLNRS